MNKDWIKALIVLAFIFGVGIVVGLGIGKAKYDRPIETSIKTDTVTIHDTIPDYTPVPKDSATIKYVTKWFPVYRTDTIENDILTFLHDTVAIAMPITSKHYGNEQYDAYISGCEPKLDSIFVYQKTEYITTTITQSKPPNKWELNVVGGINYNTAQKEYKPFAVGELLYKPSRLQFGIQGGVVKNGDKAEPIVGAEIKLRVL